MPVKSGVILVLGVAMAAMLGGCAMRTPTEPPPRLTADAPAMPYVLKVGDNLDIRFYKTPELNVEVPVRSDGKVSLELLGDVPAAGLTPDELSSDLMKRYAKELTDPRVTVIVRAFGGQITVSGEVKYPKAVLYANGMTALQAIGEAGGFAETARLTNVVLIRHDGREYKGYLINAQTAMTGEDLAGDVPLRPSDIIVVPRSRVANANLFVKQYIRDMLPVDPTAALVAF
jgi:protein involved in polysaccharide export with SLBB domain